MEALKLFIVLLTAFLAADLGYWISGRETMTQCIIKRTKANKVLAEYVALVILTAAAFLLFHFELFGQELVSSSKITVRAVESGGLALDGGETGADSDEITELTVNPRCFRRRANLTRCAYCSGNLWKPESDNSPKGLVLLFGDQFERAFSKVTVYRPGKGKRTIRENLRFTGFANGNRQHWRGTLPGGAYDGRIRAVDIDATGNKQICRFRVANPGERNE